MEDELELQKRIGHGVAVNSFKTQEAVHFSVSNLQKYGAVLQVLLGDLPTVKTVPLFSRLIEATENTIRRFYPLSHNLSIQHQNASLLLKPDLGPVSS